MKYKVGDKVIPICGNGGTVPGNITSMGELIGKVCTIREARGNDYRLAENDYCWSEEWLKPAEEPVQGSIYPSEINGPINILGLI